MSEKPTGYWYCLHCKNEADADSTGHCALCGGSIEWLELDKPSYEDLERSLAIHERALETPTITFIEFINLRDELAKAILQYVSGRNWKLPEFAKLQKSNGRGLANKIMAILETKDLFTQKVTAEIDKEATNDTDTE